MRKDVSFIANLGNMKMQRLA